MRRLVVVGSLAGVSVIAMSVWAAPEPAVVMGDEKCTMIATDLSAFDLKTIVGEKFVRVCARTAQKMLCSATDEHGVAEKESYVVGLEESPHLMMVSTETQSILTIDWSLGRYVWLSSTVKPGSHWLVTQKQCVGRILTGAAAEKVIRQGSRKSSR